MIDENAIVEKSRNVVAMQCLNMGEHELKILDVYLSRIDPRDKATREVTFTQVEYEKLIGVKEINRIRFKQYIHHLMQNIVSIDLPDNLGSNEYTLFPLALIRKRRRSETDTVGITTVTLSVNPALDDIFFDIKNLGYIKYRLENIVKLTGKFEIKLYLLLKTYEYKGITKEVSFKINELKDKIECYTITNGVKKYKYTSSRNFQFKVIKIAVQSINDYTDLNVTYEKTRKTNYGDEKFIFTVESKKKKKPEVKPDVKLEVPDNQGEAARIAELEAELAKLRAEKPELTPYGIPKDVYADEDFDLDVLKLKIASVYPGDEVKLLDILGKANIRYDSKKAKSPFLYYLGIVKKILEEPFTSTKEKAEKPNKFHNFDQREYDYDVLLHEINNTAE